MVVVVVVVMFESNVVVDIVVLMTSESFVVAVVVDRAKVVVRLENCVAFVVVFENNTSLVVVELSLEFSVVVENVVVELVVVVFELSCELTPPNQQVRIARDRVSNIPPLCSIVYIPVSSNPRSLSYQSSPLWHCRTQNTTGSDFTFP